MRAVIQRVGSARVQVDGTTVGEIGLGMLVLLGIATGDTEGDARTLARKTAALRIFADGDRPFDLSVRDVSGAALVVSQFTLHGEVRRGNRPSWAAAARPEAAEPLVDSYTAALMAGGVTVKSGQFGANMQVQLVNDGPVTLVIDTEELGRPRSD